MSYMKKFLEISIVHIEAVSNDQKKRYLVDLKSSSRKEAEINFYTLMRAQKQLEPGDDYTIHVMDVRSAQL